MVLNQRLNDSPFTEGFILKYPQRSENREVQGGLHPQDEFGDIAAHGRALLESMTGKPVGEVKALELRPLAEDGIAVQSVDGIKAGPSPDHLECVKGRNKLRKLWPEKIHEPFLIPREIKSHRIILQGLPEQDKISSFSSEVKT
jgi:hypothetical protein